MPAPRQLNPMTNSEYADALRLLADFYEAHPDMTQPSSPNLTCYFHKRKPFLAAVGALSDIGAGIHKSISNRSMLGAADYLMSRAFGGLSLILTISLGDLLTATEIDIILKGEDQ